MKRSISIAYTLPGQITCEIPLNYEITKDGDLQRLACTVDAFAVIPSWLQFRKFQVNAQFTDGAYDALYNEDNNSRNVDSMLFIDKAYIDIMQKERIEIHMIEPIES